MPVTPTETLNAAIERRGLALPAEQVALLDRYVQLLWSWNERLNLTRHTTYDLFAARDVLDSWHLSGLLAAGERVLDVGTGGGVPGVLLAILRSDLDVSLCESIGKKARAVAAIVRELDLRVSVHASRAEELLERASFDTLVARAVGPLSKLCGWLTPHAGAFGRLLVIKGPAWIEERADARHRGLLRNVSLRKAATYVTPGTGVHNAILQLMWRGAGASDGRGEAHDD